MVAAEVAAEAVIEEAEVLEEAEVEVEEAEEETVANNQTFRDAQEIGGTLFLLHLFFVSAKLGVINPYT